MKKEMEIVREVKLNDGRNGTLTFYHNGEEGEIIYSYMIADSRGDDNDWEQDIVTAEQANEIMDKYAKEEWEEDNNKLWSKYH